MQHEQFRYETEKKILEQQLHEQREIFNKNIEIQKSEFQSHVSKLWYERNNFEARLF